jgi:hypothetical protein
VAHTWYWSAWDKREPAPHATSAGTPRVNSCIPNCAQGKESYHKLVVALSVVKTHNGVRHFGDDVVHAGRLPGARLPHQHRGAALQRDPFWHADSLALINPGAAALATAGALCYVH